MILTKKEIEILQQAFVERKQEVLVSLDLGLSKENVKLSGDIIVFPDGSQASLSDIGKVDDRSCYVVQDGHFVKAQIFSEATQRFYKLVPTSNWPTVTISGVPMHQKTRATPKRDSVEKTNTIDIHDHVLDTCTGLGYTAIVASKKAHQVTTVENDESILELAALNPYSKDLFGNKKIELMRGDVSVLIKKFPDAQFNVVLHDPPTFKLAGELFGRAFYAELFRVLKPRGWLFHYTGRVGIKSGRRFVDEVIQRLASVGFTKIRKVMDNQGVICQKGTSVSGR